MSENITFSVENISLSERIDKHYGFSNVLFGKVGSKAKEVNYLKDPNMQQNEP